MTAADSHAPPVTRRVALVTGGAQGIGAAIALRLAEDGFAVGVTDIARDDACSVANRLAASGAEATAAQLDVTDAQSVRDGVRAVENAIGPVDVLVNNAGVVRVGSFLKMDEQAWDDVMAVNVKGIFLMTREVAGSMIERRRGAIVNLASIVAYQVFGPYAAYHASKAAVIGLTQALAIELAPKGITVNAVAPGIVDTPILDVLGGRDRAVPPDAIPLRRLAEPADIAACVSFLASPDAAYVTGETLAVDGGLRRAGVRR